jgi:hypothetical protein
VTGNRGGQTPAEETGKTGVRQVGDDRALDLEIIGAIPLTREFQDRGTLVATFLKCTLAASPVAVGEIEVQARHAGVLAPTQKITGAKLFRQAKKVLGIRSKKIGFGAAGSWCWELPETARSTLSQSPEQPSTKDVPAGATYVKAQSDPEQSCTEGSAEVQIASPQTQLPEIQAGSISKVGGVATWIDGVERLNYFRVPAGVPSQRWKQFIDDCKAFLDPLEGRAERAVERGWNTLDVFGSHPSRPLSYLGIAGLLWSVRGGRVIEIHRDWAVIEYAATGTRRNFDRRRPQQANLTLPWWLR